MGFRGMRVLKVCKAGQSRRGEGKGIEGRAGQGGGGHPEDSDGKNVVRMCGGGAGLVVTKGLLSSYALNTDSLNLHDS